MRLPLWQGVLEWEWWGEPLERIPDKNVIFRDLAAEDRAWVPAWNPDRIAGSPTPQQMQEAQARLKVIELGWPNDTPAYGQFFAALHIPDASTVQMDRTTICFGE